ncbi:hypothetical protein ACJ72_00236 [Emergomyces africanus]|uniref:Uncharacterized protein n=1 Tax=Emergomyces africanus TaxID=1955775 RepID=A0A1B7P8Q9_9EURO|nr:hypothetical protein ACJ72_00236 [Emergomyces africanus]
MLNTLTKMLRLSNTPSAPTSDGEEISAEADEPPDDRKSKLYSNLQNNVSQPYAKARPSIADVKKESLLTRALLSSPELSPIDSPNLASHINGFNGNYPSSVQSNVSGPSTAELTSDGETKTPPRSDSPSPPIPSGFALLPPTAHGGMQFKNHVGPTTDTPGSEIEANLGRKRRITFACVGRVFDNDEKASSEPVKDTSGLPKRKSMLTFVCPSRPTGDSDSKVERTNHRRNSLPRRDGISTIPMRKSSSDASTSSEGKVDRRDALPMNTPGAPRVPGLGGFELSDATRFHEFGSSLEDDDWINQVTDYKVKMTLNDCMKKELAIRKLGEEAEEEARQDEEDAENDEDDDDDDGDNNDDDDDDDDDDDGDDGDEDGDNSTLQDGVSDAGNESDNEAGFADSDESDNESEYAFWAPSMATAATSVDNADFALQNSRRRSSYSSTESSKERENDREKMPPPPQPRPCQRHRQSSKTQKRRPGTPDLPDSTDFVCGTFDEDRPLEAAYISCMERRRRAKHILIPQDIDPSFPTTDPEDGDGDDDDDDNNDDDNDGITQKLNAYDSEGLRGRQKVSSQKTTPSHSPKRLQSPPPPRRVSGNSPRRLRSPPPTMRLKSPPPFRHPSLANAAIHPVGMNVTGLAQRPTRRRTRSLPRTPNPFFARLERRRSTKTMPTPTSPSDCANRDVHTRGPIDIVVGLEQKRQKRKEKFWRQHCRKAAKEHLERKPLPGKGAERMKELGLEVAERFRAYGVGVGQGAQVVLSI